MLAKFLYAYYAQSYASLVKVYLRDMEANMTGIIVKYQNSLLWCRKSYQHYLIL